MNAPQIFRHQHVDPHDGAPGYRLAQLALAQAFAVRERCGVVPLVQQMFVNDAAALSIARTAAGAADTSTSAWAAALVKADTVALLRDIAPVSAVAQLAALGAQFQFAHGAIVVPSIPLVDPNAVPAWVGEGGTIPVLKGTVAGQRITPYKLAGTTAITQELSKSGNGVASMRVLLRQAAAAMLDRSAFDDAAGVPFVRPPGLLFGVTPITGSSAGGTLAMSQDVAALGAAFAAAGLGANIVLVTNSATRAALGVATNGTFGGLQVIGSPAVAPDVVIAIDAGYFSSAIDPLAIDVSGNTVLTMADADGTAPTQAMTAAGALGEAGQVPPDHGIHVSGHAGAAAVGFQAVSMFQTWSLTVRLTWPCGYAVAPGAVQVVDAITWLDAPA